MRKDITLFRSKKQKMYTITINKLTLSFLAKQLPLLWDLNRCVIPADQQLVNSQPMSLEITTSKMAALSRQQKCQLLIKELQQIRLNEITSYRQLIFFVKRTQPFQGTLNNSGSLPRKPKLLILRASKRARKAHSHEWTTSHQLQEETLWIIEGGRR